LLIDQLLQHVMNTVHGVVMCVGRGYAARNNNATDCTWRCTAECLALSIRRCSLRLRDAGQYLRLKHDSACLK
jgi:hypothetical protein